MNGDDCSSVGVFPGLTAKKFCRQVRNRLRQILDAVEPKSLMPDTLWNGGRGGNMPVLELAKLHSISLEQTARAEWRHGRRVLKKFHLPFYSG